METITLDTYLTSITNQDFLVEGITPASVKGILHDIKTSNDVEKLLKKHDKKVKSANMRKMESDIDKAAKEKGIEKDGVTTAKVMLKRALGAIFVGVPATILLPISLACLIACIIRSLKNGESVSKNAMSLLKEIKSGIKTTRRTNITNMEKAMITAGQATNYMWGILSIEPIIVIKNLLAFIGMYIAAVFYFYKGIAYAGKRR